MSATDHLREGTEMHTTVKDEDGTVLATCREPVTWENLETGDEEEIKATTQDKDKMIGENNTKVTTGDKKKSNGSRKNHATQDQQAVIKYEDQANGLSESSKDRKKTHLDLDRLTYTIHVAGMPAGMKVERKRRGIEGADCVYQGWPMYNDFKPITKEDEGSWPPQYVILQDWHVFQILKAEFSIKKRCDFWPADFHVRDLLHEQRNPKGRAAKINQNGTFYYIVLSSGHQLSGDEGSQTVTKIPKDVWMAAAVEFESGEFILGQQCEIQDDFVPSIDELKHGTLSSRLPVGSDGPHPLHNRNNWGSLTKVEIPKETVVNGAGATNTRKRLSLEPCSSTRKVSKTSGSASPAKGTKTTTGLKKIAKKRTARAESVAGSAAASSDSTFKKSPSNNDEPILSMSNTQNPQKDFREVLQLCTLTIQQAMRYDIPPVVVLGLESALATLNYLKNLSNDYAGQVREEFNGMDVTPADTPEDSQATQ